MRRKCLHLISPALSGQALNLPTFAKLQKFRQSLAVRSRFANRRGGAVFRAADRETHSQRPRRYRRSRRGALGVLAQARRARGEAGKGGFGGKSPPAFEDLQPCCRRRRASRSCICFCVRSIEVVQDRIRNYLQKYIPTAQEITDRAGGRGGIYTRYAEVREGESGDDRKAAGCPSERSRRRKPKPKSLSDCPSPDRRFRAESCKPDELVARERLAEKYPGPEQASRYSQVNPSDTAGSVRHGGLPSRRRRTKAGTCPRRPRDASCRQACANPNAVWSRRSSRKPPQTSR